MIRLRAMGECAFDIDGRRITPESDVLFALLLYLGINAGPPVARADLMDLLWPGCDRRSAQHRLRQALYQLKRLGVPLLTLGGDVVLSASDVELDFVTCQASTDSLIAVSLGGHRLEFLPRYMPSLAVPFVRWLESERDRIHDALRRRLSSAIAQLRARAAHPDVVLLARACLELDPLNEAATIALAEALAADGNKAEALAVLDRFRGELPTGHRTGPRSAAELRRRIVEMARRVPFDKRPQIRIVGRTRIVQRLAAWVNDPELLGKPVIVFSGESGIGKTRLLGEGTRIATLHGMRCVEYRSSANGADRPLAGLLDLLPRLLRLPGAVGCTPESFARLSELARGVPAEASIPEDTTDSAFRFATLRRSILDLMDAVVAEGDVLLSLDDAHWLDRDTLDILLDATRCSPHRLGVLLAARPGGEVGAALHARPEALHVRVPPLDATASRAIVAGQLSGEALQDRTRLIDWAVDLANGNPFFLVELSAHCCGDDATESLPETLQTALQRRVDALSPAARLVLQSCAVLGQNSTMARLDRMLALPPHAAASALSELEQAALLSTRDGRVACRHDLIADAVVRGLGATLASYLHRRCAVVLDEEIQSSPAASVAWDCALHWDAAGEHDRAFDLTGLIADQLLSLGLPKGAVDLCTRGERYCRTPEQHAERLLRLSRARRLLDDWNGVIEALVQRRSLLVARATRAERYSDDEIALFEAQWWRDYDGRVLRPAMQRVVDQRAPALHRLQMAVIALIVADNHQRRRAAERIVRSVESIETVTPREDTERARARLVYHTAFGDLDIALTAAAQVVNIERLGGSSAALLRALRWSSIPAALANRVPDAVTTLSEAYQHAERLGLRAEMWHAARYLADLAIDCENTVLAREWAPLCHELAGDPGNDALKSANSAYILARVALMEGDLDKSRVLLDQSRALHSPILRTRAEESVIALDVLLQAQARERKVPHELTERLRSLHLRTRACGVRDFEVGALLYGLATQGQHADARTLNEAYHTMYRRSRLRPHSALRTALTQIELGGA